MTQNDNSPFEQIIKPFKQIHPLMDHDTSLKTKMKEMLKLLKYCDNNHEMIIVFS